jgi:hypothetical protein
MKRSQAWSPTTNLMDYRRRARNRNLLANTTLIGLGLAFLGIFVAAAAGITTILQWIFSSIGHHLPSIAWTAPTHKSMVALALWLF